MSTNIKKYVSTNGKHQEMWKEISRKIPFNFRQGPRLNVRIVIWILKSDTETLFGVHKYFSSVQFRYFQRLRRQAVQLTYPQSIRWSLADLAKVNVNTAKLL